MKYKMEKNILQMIYKINDKLNFENTSYDLAYISFK